jgi:hypothetical protein
MHRLPYVLSHLQLQLCCQQDHLHILPKPPDALARLLRGLYFIVIQCLVAAIAAI